ncbi:response regulator [Nocardioides marmotae]|uniref:Response regulator n=1 Tax=Nocardioides marmotae TaxID=2663857 RepID=A0A6I3J059_9ACTN|nr:response regulator [Nocardioides marmotae]MCR6029886.1 response regulator [Gordonia jinghuaiqii]MBC9732842.1 response regulator [Nocardioides marmotae]MTB83956.1 response regulator [Nocardioides marmotae]MTB93516.1 response regulator [Nocardioides marmotae]QKD99891.1 response regulator [Nocardioides marmotae]
MDDPPARPLRFLVVEDTEDIRWVTARMVQQLGHHADEAADGVEAVEALQAASYDVMLLDLSMPRMTGEEVVRWLRDNPAHGQGMRVVVVSAWGGERRAALDELGVDEFIAKPLRKAQLAALVERLDQPG